MGSRPLWLKIFLHSCRGALHPALTICTTACLRWVTAVTTTSVRPENKWTWRCTCWEPPAWHPGWIVIWITTNRSPPGCNQSGLTCKDKFDGASVKNCYFFQDKKIFLSL